MEKSVIIHGHFYQPPRINPWSGILLKQESAAPADNWNERILNECYLPNTMAKIPSSHGSMVEVNNFEIISFDIGPTLFRWIVENYVDAYREIVEADRKSQNAIALPYNHTILPLDNEILQKAQILWGM
jgi:alpha-amylase/alpha-mannosidase (GH57 family)